MNMDYFNAEQTRDNLVQWIRDWFDKNGPGCRAVIGISGGKDSTIAAGLTARAIGKERVLGVLMPNGVQKDIGDSIAVCNSLGIKYIIVNINDGYKGIAGEVRGSIREKIGIETLSDQTLINLAPRLRMTTLYAVSQTIGGRVVNTSNLSECFVGYGTLYGDLAGSMYPLKNLTKSEIVEIGKTMTEIPIELVEKTPSDGLTGFTDENKFGFTYDELDSTIRFGTKGEHYDTIMKRHKDNLFKLKPFEEFHPYINKETP
jgi:NAD+ synthase